MHFLFIFYITIGKNQHVYTVLDVLQKQENKTALQKIIVRCRAVLALFRN